MRIAVRADGRLADAADDRRLGTTNSNNYAITAGSQTMGRTISTTLTAGVTLQSGDNPVSNTGTGKIITSDTAIYGTGGGSYSWTISNSGTINETQTLSGVAIQFGSGGYGVTNGVIVNQSGGVITSVHDDIVFNGDGMITNMAGGTIISSDAGIADAIYLNGSGTVVNGGLLQAANFVIFGYSGASDSITNLATGTIIGAAGVYLTAGGTITNARTIIGTDSTYGAVELTSPTAPARVIVDRGAVVNGAVDGGTPSHATLELASAASAGTITNLASFTNFGVLTFDPSSQWLLSGASAGLLSTATISGFAAGDTLVIPGTVSVSHSSTSGGFTRVTLSTGDTLASPEPSPA